MNMDNCTTMLNRSNYCSILKKRKSSCKENTITVKLKRYTIKEEKEEDKIGNLVQLKMKNNNPNNIESKNSTMCLICRTQNNCCLDGMICNSMATLYRQQHQSRKYENDSINNNTTSHSSKKSQKHHQNIKSYVATKTSSTSSIPFDTSPSPLSSSSSSPTATKWNVLEIANQKSKSQWNAASVSCCWNASCSSVSDKSSMPSCQLQSTSFSSPISPPIFSKTLSSSTTSNKINTSLLLSSTQQQLLSPAACSSSSAEVAAAEAASTIEISSSSSAASTIEISSSSAAAESSLSTTTKTSSSLEAIASSQLSSRTNTSATTSLSLSLQLPLALPVSSSMPSCIKRTSLSCNSKSCASLLRTLALVAVILEKCFIGKFGTRPNGMPIEHGINNDSNNNNNRVTVSNQKSKQLQQQSFISSGSGGLPKYPIMIMFLSFSFMTLMMLPMTTYAAGAEVELQGTEKDYF